VSLPPDDEYRTLVEKIQRGEDYERNCERLFLSLHPRLLRFFRSRGFAPDDSEDLTQKTLTRVFRSMATFQFDSWFGVWLFKIAVNVYRNELRRLKAGKRNIREQTLDEESEHQADLNLTGLANPGSAAPDPLDQALERERREALRHALNQLSPRLRRCLLLRLEGYKYKDIATLMDISIETVKSHIYQAKQRLKQTLRWLADRLETVDEAEKRD